ncbi:uncharacterized protein [Battus philenor]|uniref:uncharacterized protein n=1 Tax=Battus philenor TaxID=42288 RepID=UPI0035D0C60D
MYSFIAVLLLFNFASGHFWHDHQGFGHHHGGWGEHGGGGWGGQDGGGWGWGGFDFSNGDGHDHGRWSGQDDGSWGGHDHGDCSGHDHGSSGGHRRWWHNHHQENDFDRLARCVISADKLLLNTCRQSPFSRTRMFIGVDFFSLKYNLAEYSEEGIMVKIKHRVIYVTADAAGQETYKDLRILPDFLNVANANWYFEHGVLVVLIPYKNPPKTEVALSCNDVSETVIDVPKSANSDNDLRFLGSVE